jgi:tetratricopeptide (TPR) repeat protein
MSAKVRPQTEVVHLLLVAAILVVFPTDVRAVPGAFDRRIEEAIVFENWSKVRELVEAIAEQKRTLVEWQVLGYAALKEKDNAAALKAFLKLPTEDGHGTQELLEQSADLVERYPRAAGPLLLRADSLARAGRQRAALETLREVPHSSLLVSHLKGNILASAGRPEEARTVFHEVLESDPGFTDALAGLGSASTLCEGLAAGSRA